MRFLRQGHHRNGTRPPAPTLAHPAALTLRVATPEDLVRIARLAALDSSRPPEAPVLIVEVDGEIWVAVSLDNLRAVADPFRPSAHVRAIALARAQQMRTVEPRRAQRRLRARHRTSEAAPRPQGAT